MAQNMLAEILRHYHVIAPTNAAEPNHDLMQELELIPQGIPALYAYSERHVRDNGAAKDLMNAFINFSKRHRGRLLDLRLLPIVCVLAYLSRPMITFALSSILESIGQDTEGTASKPIHPSYMSRATQTCGPDPDASPESHPEQETVTFTVAEIMWLKDLAADLLANEDKAKIRQADMLTAIGDLEDENEELKDEVSTLEKKIADDTAHFEARIRALENQHTEDKDDIQKLCDEREKYRREGKNLKKELEKLQKEYNDLEDDRDDRRDTAEGLGVMAEELKDDFEGMKTQRDDLEKANGLLVIDKEEAEAKAAIDRDAVQDLEDIYEDLDKEFNRQKRELQEAEKEISRQKRELQEAAKETADLKAQLAVVSAIRWEELDDFESDPETEKTKEEKSTAQAIGSQVGAEEKSSKPSSQPKTVEQSEAENRRLKNELDELKAVHDTLEPSRDTWRGAVFEQPEGLKDSNVEEGAPIRRIQSAPLWLPLSHHGDNFDPLYDVSDYGDDDDHDDDAGDEDHDKGQSDQDDTHDSGDDNGNGSDQDENDDDDEDDGRDGGAEKVAIDAHQTRQDHVADTTPLSEDTPSQDSPLNDGHMPIVPEPSPRQASFNLNVGAPEFVPTMRPTRPVSSRAMGPDDARNAHIKKLNEELKRRTWMEKSGKPDLVEDKEGVAVADDVIDDMYDRQVTQLLNFDPIQYARGSMWGALNDVPSRVDDMSISSKKDDDDSEASQNTETQQNLDAHSSGPQEGDEEHDEDDGEWLDVEDEDHEENDAVMPMLGKYQVTRGQKDDQEDDATPMLGNYKVTRGPESINKSSKESQKKPTMDTQKTNRSITPAHCESETPKDEEESEAAGDWTDVEDGTDEEDQDEDSPEENGGIPMLGKDKVTRGDTPSDSDHENSEAEKESGHDSSPSLACGTSAQEMSRQDVTTPVRVSQFAGPSTSGSDPTNQPDDAAASRAPPQGSSNPTNVPKPQPPPGAPTGPRAHRSRTPSPKSSNSNPQTPIQPNNPDTTPRVRLPPPRQCGIDNPDPTPRVRLPQQPMQNQTQPAPVTPSTRTSTQGELESRTDSPRAIFRQPPRTLEPPSMPANQGSPLPDVPVASPSRSANGGMHDNNRTPPTGPAAEMPHRSPRSNARGDRRDRGAHQLPQNMPATTPTTKPQTPAHGSGTQNPSSNIRNGDGGSGQQQGSVRGTIPRGPAAAPITNNDKTPTRQSGRGRGAGDANSSFRRFQERMGRGEGG